MNYREASARSREQRPLDFPLHRPSGDFVNAPKLAGTAASSLVQPHHEMGDSMLHATVMGNHEGLGVKDFLPVIAQRAAVAASRERYGFAVPSPTPSERLKGQHCRPSHTISHRLSHTARI